MQIRRTELLPKKPKKFLSPRRRMSAKKQFLSPKHKL
jgi:hypothetical protein